jgi:uncharacterized protein
MKVEMRKKLVNFEADFPYSKILVMDIVKAVKSQINRVAPKNEVILFGSRARGDHKKDSDWDFLILLHTKTISKLQKEEIQARLYDIELATDEVISSIIHTKAEREKRAVTSIYKSIQKEGFKV